MNLLRIRIHLLIEQLTDDELEKVWSVVYALHCDCYVMKSIQEGKRLQQPWDTLTHEDALQLLIFS